MTSVSFWQVAKRPKWIGGLGIALLISVTFSLLMQWQLSRTFNTVGIENPDQDAVPITELVTAGEPVTSPVFDRLVKFEATLETENLFVVSSRLQLVGDATVPGYWLIGRSVQEDAMVTLALGFSENLEKVLAAKTELEITPQSQLALEGLFEPTEGVAETDGEILGSINLGQLMNLYSGEVLPSYPGYVIVTNGLDLPELEKISIGIRQAEIEVNWLTAFYAIEWAFFALAAFYLWGRLVMDQVIRERGL